MKLLVEAVIIVIVLYIRSDFLGKGVRDSRRLGWSASLRKL